MLPLPSAAEPLFLNLSVAFTQPTFQRAVLLAVGTIVALGRRTVSRLLWTMRESLDAHASTYHRVFSRAVWSLWALGKVLATAILAFLPPDQPVLVPLDDTVAQHRGPRVYGKGRHRDAVRSTHSLTVWRWGHRWIVLAISVQFPFLSRPWALPVLAALYRPEELNRKEGRRHKTAPRLARQLMAVLMHWFPQRTFIFLGDGGYASHELAAFCHRHRRHATLVSRFWPDANLYTPPPKRTPRTGRPPKKGRKLPSPQQVVSHSPRTKGTVRWYGGGSRRVEWVSGTAHWHKAGQGLVPVRWVFVHDLQGTHRDEYFYTTDPNLTAPQIISLFTARWSIETTFQEVRAHLGFETTRQHVARSVLRTAPCLLGLFSLICLILAQHARHHRLRPHGTAWYAKAELTFSDALTTVRRLLWSQTLLKQSPHAKAFTKLPRRFQRVLLDCLIQAA